MAGIAHQLSRSRGRGQYVGLDEPVAGLSPPRLDWPYDHKLFHPLSFQRMNCFYVIPEKIT
jgi:hypothetical protein